jgi:hypothetical protein
MLILIGIGLYYFIPAREPIPSSITLPRQLLGAASEESRNAHALDRLMINEWAGGSSFVGPAAGVYGDLTGSHPGFEVTAAILAAGSAPYPIRRAVPNLHFVARFFPAGPHGGVLECGRFHAQERGTGIACIWSDPVTVGTVVYLGGFASTAAVAAADTNQIRNVAEPG